jgi:tetratricopeptide (TPR) repeat protein
MNYSLANNLEQQERYIEAAEIYQDYLTRNPNAPDANKVSSYMSWLRRVQAALDAGDSAMKARRYIQAIKLYERALTLRPESQRAKAGLQEAGTEIKNSLPPRRRRGFPFDQDELPRGGARPGRQRQQDQDQPAQTFPRRPRSPSTPPDHD